MKIFHFTLSGAQYSYKQLNSVLIMVVLSMTVGFLRFLLDVITNFNPSMDSFFEIKPKSDFTETLNLIPIAALFCFIQGFT